MAKHQQHVPSGLKTGILFAAVTLAVAWFLPIVYRLEFLAGILFLTAGIYLGFAWVDARPAWVRVESVVAIPFFAAAWVGLHIPWVLALGFVVHLAWDLAHHPRGIQTKVARWLPPACLIYDGVIALAILLWWPPWA